MAQSTDAHIEVELKLLLDTELDYAALRSWLDAHGTVREAVQSNRYLDTTDRILGARRMMMRVRLAGEKATCTAKAGAQMVDGVMRVQEWEQRLPAEVAASWHAGRGSSPLKELPICDAMIAGPLHDVVDAAERVVHVIGVMQTTRRAYHVPCTEFGLPAGEPLMLELDHSLFPAGQERFELEVEHSDALALKSAMTGLLDSLQVAWRPADISKYEQFLRAQAIAPGLEGDETDALTTEPSW